MGTAANSTNPRGHVWVEDRLGHIDYFRLDSGDHNGPECARCHAVECEHCHPEFLTEDCPEYGTELPGLEL